MTSGSGAGGRLLASFPVDVRNGGGIGITKQGLATRVAIDLRNTQRLTTLPLGGLVPVQDPGTGLIGALPVSALPTAQTGDGSQTNAKLATMPPRTFKANLLSTTAAPQDVNFAQVLEALGITSGGSVATSATNVSVVPPASQSYTNVQGAITSIEGRIGSGNGAITSNSITDASPSGKSVLIGTPTQGRAALGLGTAATRDVGVVGGVVDFNDPRLGTTGAAISNATIVSTNPEPPWANGKGQFDRVRVSVGPTDAAFWAGGDRDKPADQQTLGCYSALTGTLNLPVESNQAVNSAGIPVTIISAGVSGLVQTSSNQNVAVGLFANARVNVPNGRVWGLNVVTSNYSSSFTPPQYGNAAQINGIEIDCTWKGTQNPTTGSNLIGIWIPAEFNGGRPDGAADAIRIGRYADFPWKNYLSSDHGSAERFAQLGMVKQETEDGASGGQGLYWITSSGGKKTGNSDTNQYHHSYLEVSPGGDILFQPDKFGGNGALLVAANDSTQNHSIHPTRGFKGALAEFRDLSVTRNATVNSVLTVSQVQAGSIGASGNGSFGGTLSCNQTATLASVVTGGLTVNGTASVQGIVYQGVAVQLSPQGSIPANAKALIVIGL